MKPAILEMEKGWEKMAKGKFPKAENHFRRALQKAPDDYAGLAMMATCQLVQKKYAEARRYAQKAKKVYSAEAQAYHLSGFAELKLKDFQAAYDDFDHYDRLLPGNPQILFFKGFAQEGLEHLPQAAKLYHRYLKKVPEGKYARYARRRLVQWGYYR